MKSAGTAGCGAGGACTGVAQGRTECVDGGGGLRLLVRTNRAAECRSRRQGTPQEGNDLSAVDAA